MMVMTRYYLPEEFADYQMFISVVNVCVILATARYELAIVVPQYRFQAANIMWVGLSISVVLSVLLLLIVGICSVVAPITNLVCDTMWWYLPTSVFLIGAYVCLYNWFVREKMYIIISIAIVVFPISNFMFALLFKYFSIDDGLIISMVVGRIIEVLLFTIIFVRKYRRYTKFPGLLKIVRYAKSYISFPKYLVGSSALENLTAACPVFLINMFFGKEIMGLYSIAVQALSAPSALVAKAVGDVFRQHVSVLYRQGIACKEYYDKNTLLLGKGALLLAGGLIICGPELFELVLGSVWRASGEMAIFMIPGVCMMLVSVPLSSMFVISMHQRNYLHIQVLYFAANVIGLFLGTYYFGSVEMTLLLTSVLISFVAIRSVHKGRIIAMSGE